MQTIFSLDHARDIKVTCETCGKDYFFTNRFGCNVGTNHPCRKCRISKHRRTVYAHEKMLKLKNEKDSAQKEIKGTDKSITA